MVAEDSLAALLEAMIDTQRARLLEIARRIDASATPDDLLQPHDHPRLASSPEFQFEDGVLSGYLAVRAALRAQR